MAYINVAEWTPDQVTDWLKGLDDSMESYVNSFTNNEVGGRQLLNIRPYELEQLGMLSIGHQEIVLEAVENLRNFYYNLDKENLQFMALHVATAAHSLHRQLVTHCDASKIETQILSDITRTIGTIKPLIGWLERAPFQGQKQSTEICTNLLRVGLEMATIAQRDRFVQGPVEQICVTAEKLERLANYIIQDITDPMLLQPASLNLVTVKKREMDPGFEIESNYHGVHRITEIKYNSPAHNSGKIEHGDEIIQINYQTVVGWQGKTVWHQLHVSPPDVLLTLKKRPKHTKIYGQIYMQPYRLPSKKRSVGSRWGENLPSPRAGFLTVPSNTAAFDLSLSLKSEEKATTTASDSESNCSDTSTPTDTKAPEKRSRLYYEKPRTVLQRRHTICGDMKSGGEVLQSQRPKAGIVGDPSSPSLRDKSKSFGFGLELASRPKTCIGFDGGAVKSDENAKKQEIFNKTKKTPDVPDNRDFQSEKSKPGVSKVVRFDADMKYEDYPVNEKYTCNVENTILETFEPILYADEEEEDVLDTQRNTKDLVASTPSKVAMKSGAEREKSSANLVEAVNVPIVARRGRLDKSHSTPAYDNTAEECETPPAIEPRKEFLLQTPPVPPPRPRKQKDITPPPVPPPPPKPPSLMGTALQPVAAAMPSALHTIRNASTGVEYAGQGPPPAAASTPTSHQQSDTIATINELHTPTKSRTLSLKKKHSLVAKRRNVNLKVLGTGDIQGHLYRRTKDRRGVTFWARLYFVMLNTILYGFRSKEATKANCVIFLPGFTVSLAKEVHSKPHAFKVYHAAKTFYFAVESQDALNQWIELLSQATLHPQPKSSAVHLRDGAIDSLNTKDLFSETDSSGEETDSMVSNNLCTPSPQTKKDIVANLSAIANATPTTSHPKQERRYLGSLRKLTKSTFKSSGSSSEKKQSSDIPVPTDQYRSYRKVPGGSFGIQIGTNTPGYHHDTSLPLSQSSPFSPSASSNQLEYSASSVMSQRKLSHSSSRTSIVSNGVDSSLTSVSTCLGPPSSPAPVPDRTVGIVHQSPSLRVNSPTSPASSIISAKSIRKIPYNFIHASNPNLVEFDFQTSKTLDYSLPKINPSNSWDAHHNIQSFITLKDLMLQKQEEEAQEMYNNRVLLGVEKKDERNAILGAHLPSHSHSHLQQHHRSGGSECGDSLAGSISSKLSKTQNRSLPKTPDYEISFKPDDEDIRRTRTKEGLKLRDFGYELISGDEPLSSGSGSGITASRQNSNISTASSTDHHSESNSVIGGRSRPFALMAYKNKKHSSNSCSSTSSISEMLSGDKRTGSFKKKSKSERIFQHFSKHTSSNSGSGMTMTLPLNKKSSNRDLEVLNSSGSGIKKSHTYNNDLKDKASVKYDAHRKNSAPMPILSKLSTTFGVGANDTSNSNSNSSINKSGKEKRLLGSPLLHRTVFGHQNQHQTMQQQQQLHTVSGVSMPATPTCTGREYDREIFSQITFPKVPTHSYNHGQNDRSGKMRHNMATSLSSTAITAPDVVAPPPPLPPHERDNGNANYTGSGTANSPEYPHMECPPVFEPEIYSLSDTNASQTLLLRRKDSASASTSTNTSISTSTSASTVTGTGTGTGTGAEKQQQQQQ